MPQEFGVTSEPWLFNMCKRKRIELHDEEESRISVNDASEDNDAKHEREKVYKI